MNNEETSIVRGWNLENSYASLPSLFFTELKPTPVLHPRLVFYNNSLAEELGLSRLDLESTEGASIFSGNRLPDNSRPLAQAYAGHQFGHFTMLGDGRAILLGEQITPSGKRCDIQLKGSGRTPYSRGGDGRAVLGPMLREYVISEAMHALGIPTTRSLAVVTTGEEVLRENKLPGAILTRVAASHLRVGTFQYAARWGSEADLRSLADYTIERHFPTSDDENPYLALLQAVATRQAKLIAGWQLTGFIHGVMNTDNMALSGETIDYGPCAFMDHYDPATVFSSIDQYGRYAYAQQPLIAQWNLARFAETILPLLDPDPDRAFTSGSEAVAAFEVQYRQYWLNGMRKKLGLTTAETSDETLFNDLLQIMHRYQADYTNTFRELTLAQPSDQPFYQSAEFSRWHSQWQARANRENTGEQERQKLMESSNPALIPRNHLVEEALQAATDQNDYAPIIKFINLLSTPYDHKINDKRYLEPTYADKPYRTFCGT
jgi:serine/tyrosine/threonine adenylyltransferase